MRRASTHGLDKNRNINIMIARSGARNAKQAHEVNTAQKKTEAFIFCFGHEEVVPCIIPSWLVGRERKNRQKEREYLQKLYIYEL